MVYLKVQSKQQAFFFVACKLCKFVGGNLWITEPILNIISLILKLHYSCPSDYISRKAISHFFNTKSGVCQQWLHNLRLSQTCHKIDNQGSSNKGYASGTHSAAKQG